MSNELASALLGVGGTLVAGMLVYFIRGFFDGRKEKSDSTASDLKAFLKEFHVFQVQYAKDQTALMTTVQHLENKVESYQLSVAKYEGQSEQQMQLIASHIQTLGHMSRQLDAIFKVVDAPKRATDANRAASNG